MADSPIRIIGPACCRYCGFTVAPSDTGVRCKSGSVCPFATLRIEYVAPPPPDPAKLAW